VLLRKYGEGVSAGEQPERHPRQADDRHQSDHEGGHQSPTGLEVVRPREGLPGEATRKPIPPITQGEIDAVLSLAAVAAHGTGDRTSAPVASFLAGIAAAGAEDRTGAIDRVRQVAGAITGPTS
jgi:hypothetical protein